MTEYTHGGRTVRTRYPWGVVRKLHERYACSDDWEAITDGLPITPTAAQGLFARCGWLRSKAEANQLRLSKRLGVDLAVMEARAVELRRERRLRPGLIIDYLDAEFGHRVRHKTIAAWMERNGLGTPGAGSTTVRRWQAEGARISHERQFGHSRAIPSSERKGRQRERCRRYRRRRARGSFEITDAMRAVAAEEAQRVGANMAKRYRGMAGPDGVEGLAVTLTSLAFARCIERGYRQDGETWRETCYMLSWQACADWAKEWHREKRRRPEVLALADDDGRLRVLDNHFRAGDTLAVAAGLD